MRALKLRVSLMLMKFATLWCAGWCFIALGCIGWAENPYPVMLLVFAAIGSAFCAACAASGIPMAECMLEAELNERERVPVKKIDRR